MKMKAEIRLVEKGQKSILNPKRFGQTEDATSCISSPSVNDSNI